LADPNDFNFHVNFHHIPSTDPIAYPFLNALLFIGSYLTAISKFGAILDSFPSTTNKIDHGGVQTSPFPPVGSCDS
jgi:hypothetical protein